MSAKQPRIGRLRIPTAAVNRLCRPSRRQSTVRNIAMSRSDAGACPGDRYHSSLGKRSLQSSLRGESVIGRPLLAAIAG